MESAPGSFGELRTSLALFLIAASVVLWEILLTRIFSVVLYYHFAFIAVSVAMFGLTLGATLAFLGVRPFAPSELSSGMGRLALASGVLMALVVGVQLSIPLRFGPYGVPRAYLVMTYLLSSLPFVPAGSVFCLALTRFRGVGYLYAADLAGAGAGCVLLPFLIGPLGGPGAVLAAGALAGLAGFVLLWPSRRGSAWLSLALAAGLASLATVNVSTQWLRVRWRHDGLLPRPMYEKWNAYSRIMVRPYADTRPFGWGIDAANYRRFRPVEQIWLEIDSGAGTPVTAFNGDRTTLDYLRYDLSSFAHQLRSGADVFIIGAGGGRDVLAAIAFDQKRILAAEVNRDIVATVNDVFGDFTGHLDRRPEIRFAADEARSLLARSDQRFDIIQASFVDTAAATAAGAFAFTENGLYTVEAWSLFLDRLKPHGILSLSRWYKGSTDWPVEVYRCMALAAAVLRSRGVADPGEHVLLVRTRNLEASGAGEGMATILVSRDRFGPEDIARARSACAEIGCDVAWSWQESLDANFGVLLHTEDLSALARPFPLDVSPPTDDRPYFFFHTRVSDVLAGREASAMGGSSFNLPALRLLLTLTLLVLVLGAGLVGFPIVWQRLRSESASPGSAAPAQSGSAGRRAWSSAFFFGAIGLAFMFVEVGLIQRLSIFLGHPTLGFTVVLAGILLLGGLGSLFSERAVSLLGSGREWWSLVLLAAVLPGVELASSLALKHAQQATTALRVILALVLLAPAALLMGLGFPMGMAEVQRRGDERAPWYWALNGALSVIASVLAMLCSLVAGIRMTLWIGALIYAGAAACLAWMVRPQRAPEGA